MFEVQNQPPPLEPYNLFTSDAALREAVRREGANWAEGDLTELGRNAWQARDRAARLRRQQVSPATSYA